MDKKSSNCRDGELIQRRMDDRKLSDELRDRDHVDGRTDGRADPINMVDQNVLPNRMSRRNR